MLNTEHMSNGHGPAADGHAKSPAKQSVAIIGFIVVAVLGIAIAVYASRFVPGALSGLAGAGAYVSNLFILEDGNGNSTVTQKPEEETPAEEEETPAQAATSTPSRPTTPTTPRPATPVYSGLSDLTVSVNAVGYCTTGAQNSLVQSSRVPDNARYGGVRFTVTNIGTNVSGPWAFEIETAASPSDTYEYAGQASLAPGQSTVGTMCFPRGTRAHDGEVTVTVDSQDRVVESNERNNEDSEDLEIESWND